MTRALVVLVLTAATAHADHARALLVVPQVNKQIACDGELDEIAWRTPARTGPLIDARGESAAPYADARFLRDGANLYLALYAADEDVRATDSFMVTFRSAVGRKAVTFTAGGAMVPVVANAHMSIDIDGTLDIPGDDDEEWVVEASLPLTAIPFGRDGLVDVVVEHCDTTKDKVHRCSSWHGALRQR